MASREVEVLAIGAGPANIALAVALEEIAPSLAADSLLVEQHDDVVWQRGMLLPWSQSQVSFLKDLVTLRNPRSRFSFVNYLHSVGRLDDFINLGSFTPYRAEISGYLSWVAASLNYVGLQYGRRCTAVEPVRTGPEINQWRARFSDGSDVLCRNLVIGAGRDAHIPAQFSSIARDRLIHSTEYLWRIDQLPTDRPLRIAVIGSGQSAAEMLSDAHQRFPGATFTMAMRSIGLNGYESSKFTNELFYPSFVDEFHAALPEAREQLLREMHRTNYSGLSPALLEVLYRQMYLEKLNGSQRIRMATMTEIVEAGMDGEDVVLTMANRRSGTTETLACDVVMLGTGFVQGMPKIIRDLAANVGVEEATVNRNYRMILPPAVQAGCYLQGVNEATHGIADSLLSLLARRSQEITLDIVAQHDSTVRRPSAVLAAS
jgi:L-ornithine N5-oxygenase